MSFARRWLRAFAWLPTRTSEGDLVWLCHYERRLKFHNGLPVAELTRVYGSTYDPEWHDVLHRPRHVLQTNLL